MAERLQKVLASAGFGSRRACEEMILEGRVSVNGQRVEEMPVLVDPQADDVRVDGRRIRFERKVYYLLNKPKGVLCTQHDPSGRKRATDLLANVKERVYPVGRLDADSEGLLLMTNDGELAAALTHPRYGVPKTYRARVSGKVGPADVARLRQGIWLSEGKTRPSRVSIAYSSRTYSVLEITLREGRNRQVRRMLAKLGHPVRELKRIRIGPLSLRGLGTGRVRQLTPSEVQRLREHAIPSKDPSAPVGRIRRNGRKKKAGSPGKGAPSIAEQHARKPCKKR